MTATQRPGRAPVVRLPRPTALVALLALASCTAAWHREPVATLAQPIGEHDQVEVWVGGEAQRLRGVRVAGDTLFAVPYFSAADCRDCGVRIRVSSIDSVRFRQYSRLTPGQTRSVMIPAVFVAALALLTLMAVGLATAAP